MAGDWIKMRSDLFTHPKVVRMSSALKADTLRTVGGLMSAWCLFDAHSIDGQLSGYTPEFLDSHLRWDGFSESMAAVGWLEFDADNGLSLPRFDTHNGQSAKRRAQDADRKRDVRKTSAPEADKKRTREEKRREEKRRDSKTDSGSAQAQPPPPAYLGEQNESEIPDKAKVPLASGWELPAGWGQDAEALGWRPDEILRESEKFRQYYVSGKGADTRRGIKGWRQSWSNWLSNAEKFTPIRRIA